MTAMSKFNYKRICSWLQFDLFDMHWRKGNRKFKKKIKKQMSKDLRRKIKNERYN